MATGYDEVIQEPPFPDTGQVTVAVVTGEHPFNVPGFHRMFRSMPEIDYYPQQLHHFVVDWGRVRSLYDVVLFFNFHLEAPPVDQDHWWWFGQHLDVLEDLGDTDQGVILLHHGIYAFPGWPFWSELVGIPHPERTFSRQDLRCSLCERIHVEIANPEHPITRGLEAWDLYGETWDFAASAPSQHCDVLLTTDHPKMQLEAMAWTHQYKDARVFCLQPGHNNDSYADPTFRTVLSRGIQWAAGRL
jgi:hypothetical protein